jgi:hypothetical protein
VVFFLLLYSLSSHSPIFLQAQYSVRQKDHLNTASGRSAGLMMENSQFEFLSGGEAASASGSGSDSSHRSANGTLEKLQITGWGEKVML